MRLRQENALLNSRNKQVTKQLISNWSIIWKPCLAVSACGPLTLSQQQTALEKVIPCPLKPLILPSDIVFHLLVVRFYIVKPPLCFRGPIVAGCVFWGFCSAVIVPCQFLSLS